MRRFIAILLMLTMAVSIAAAEDAGRTVNTQTAVTAAQYDYDELVVGTVMPMYGAFSMDNWGNSTSDVDVRKLIHGYNLTEWDSARSGFRLNPSVVTVGSVVSQDVSGDRLYSMTLYDDLRYSDGTKITAWDYAFSWLLRASPLIGEIGGKSLHAPFLRGWDEYAAGETPYLAGVRVSNERQLQIRIKAEYLPFFYEVGLLDCYPYPIQAIAPGCEVADDGSGVYIRNRDSSVAEPLFTAELLKETMLNETDGYLTHPAVVSGAYRLLSFDGTEARFELNPYYKGNSEGLKPMIQRIIYRVADADTMIDEMLQGKYGLLNKVSRADVIEDGTLRAVITDTHYTQSVYPRQGLSFITFNGNRPATADPEGRKAIALCLDKTSLTQKYVGNYGVKADNFYGLGQWMYQMATGTLTAEPDKKATEEEQEKQMQAWEAITLDGIEAYEFDTARAAKLLDDAGWTLNRDGNAYQGGTDEVRCKEIDGQLVPLELMFDDPATTEIGEERFWLCITDRRKRTTTCCSSVPTLKPPSTPPACSGLAARST